ncbi:MAG TPA: BTAD domain-containing putative transcriptional regulator [Beutenbergiaceae bacterium]|nr:BTAD domain-containing putative transcriptional regulator [Beutenbergiaceae bacterium]
MVQIQLLGGVAATTDQGTPVELGATKARVVLAALALSAGQPVAVTRLIDLVWAENPPRTAEKTLQGYIADLRRRLGAALITRTGAAYRLDVPQSAIDVHRFRGHLAAGDTAAALDQWRGAPLAGLTAPGLQPAVDALIQQWLSAIEASLADAAHTDPARAVATLTQLTAEHPSREELWALLMSALYRTGQQTEALAAYHRARKFLVEELGVEPGPRLREVERQILAQDEALSSESAAGLTEPGAQPEATGVGRLYGRERELGEVITTLTSAPLVTLVGPGGIGKTALARAAAGQWRRQHRQRVAVVELGDVAGPGAVVRWVADALGIIERADTTLSESIAAVLRSSPTLLVLDNCEHLIDDAAALASTIVATSSASAGSVQSATSRMLATSREPLNVVAEQLVRVGPLDDEAARDLFIDRTQGRAAGPVLDGAESTIAEICQRLDGLPLAIELAAAQTSSMSVPELLARLNARFRLLTDGRRDAADRHRTLRATVAWSYDLLNEAEQQLFQRLSVFTGSFTWAAAESVAGFGDLDAVDVDVLVDSLVNRSMVTADPRPSGTHLALLETLRDFAAEQLASNGDSARLAARHADWCADEVTEIHRMLVSEDEIEGVQRLNQLWPNLRTALDWACRRADWRMAETLVRPIAAEANLRRRAEISDWAERIVELIRADGSTQNPGQRADVAFWLMWAANRHVQAGDTESYQRLIDRYGYHDHPLLRYAHAYAYDDGEEGYRASRAARQWLRDRGEHHVANLVEIAGVGGNLMGMGRFDELDELAAELEQRYRTTGPPSYLYFALGLRGYAAQFQGRHDDARAHFAASSEIWVPSGTFLVNRTVEARTRFDAGEAHRGLIMLLEHVEDVLATDYVDVVKMVAVEFVYMVARLGHLRAAGRVLGYLRTTGSYGLLAEQTVLADVVQRLHQRAEVTQESSAVLSDGRHTLTFMREVLSELTDGGQIRGRRP